MAGRKPGTPKTGGRTAGVTNKANREAKIALEELAKNYTDVALKALVDVATNGQAEAARVSAASALLDRGYGKPRQSVEMQADVRTELQTLTDEELNARIIALDAASRA